MGISSSYSLVKSNFTLLCLVVLGIPSIFLETAEILTLFSKATVVAIPLIYNLGYIKTLALLPSKNYSSLYK